jgi:ferredoxin/flavodoxin---NADP+ reductase
MDQDGSAQAGGDAAAAPLRAAIIGAGPSGFYAAAQLLAAAEPEFAVDLFDRLPTPYGLVRAGVAPDHPKIKSVTRAYDKTARHPRFRFFGHVELGTDITREDLLERYHVVLYAVGTATDKRLGIPGEDLRGSHAATEFVAWYNGHPDHTGLEFDLRASHAVVVGNGNVAMDVARMLALAPAELEGTDVADHALEALRASGVRDITLLGRRGPAQVAFTNPELLEMGELERADLEVADGELDDLSAAWLADQDRTAHRNVEILEEYAERPPSGKPITVRFRFLASPVELLGDAEGRVRGVRIERNAIAAREDGTLAARGTGTFEELPAQLVFRSIGYRGVPMPGIPFDADRGLIRNAGGRVCGEDGAPLPGEYVTGWIKRGPSGVIGTNKKDSQETVASIFEDMEAGRIPERPNADAAAIDSLLRERRPELVTFEGWRAIDAAEQERGKPQGRPRVKFCRIEEMVEAASSAGVAG